MAAWPAFCPPRPPPCRLCRCPHTGLWPFLPSDPYFRGAISGSEGLIPHKSEEGGLQEASWDWEITVGLVRGIVHSVINWRFQLAQSRLKFKVALGSGFCKDLENKSIPNVLTVKRIYLHESFIETISEKKSMYIDAAVFNPRIELVMYNKQMSSLVAKYYQSNAAEIII